MRKILLILTTFLINSTVGFTQQKDQWIENLKLDERYSSNKILEYNNYNFSSLFVPKYNFLGFIGSNYRKINIYLTSICRDESNMNLYHFTGISLVGNNKCDFEGTVSTTEIREANHMHYGVDDMYKNSGIESQGILIGEYQFLEDPRQTYAGAFEGVVTLWWFIDRHGILHYDDIQDYSDGYINNQYVGTWTEYNKTHSKICNWGIRRIPFSEDLDIGAGEFSPNPKYNKYGWSKFR